MLLPVLTIPPLLARIYAEERLLGSLEVKSTSRLRFRRMFLEEARYFGSGDVNLAARWTCNANDTRM